MKTKIFLIIIILSISIIIGATPMNNLLPTPSNIEYNDGKFSISNSFNISYGGNSNRVKKAIDRISSRISRKTGIFFESKENTSSQSKVEVKHLSNAKLKLHVDESYSLNVSTNSIVLNANTDIGVLRGLETLYQLIENDSNTYYFKGCEIEDSPRFPWRGLMLDVCRHFMPIEVILRNIEGMAAVKMNVLHLHLSEDQGFRVECKSLPKLHELGSDGKYFTHQQINKIVDYADDFGIRVVPEFDIPGHSTSWLVGYPELASAPGPYSIERNFGIKDPTFNPTIEQTYEFFDIFFKEITTLFPDEFVHIGGDENNGKHWDANNQIQEYMKQNQISDNHELQAYFNTRISKILAKYGKKIIGWDEILHDDIPKDIVIQSWRGKEALITSAKKGYQGILSNGYYIDLVQPTEFHYLNDPIENPDELTEAERSKILGGEATMWSEWVTPENVDSRIWPRTAAIAERLWSPQNVKDLASLYRRLESTSLILENIGLTHVSFQDKMLRRLTNGKDITPLKVIIDYLEPLEMYKRAQDARENGFKYTQLSPYSRIIDATRIDSWKLLEFRSNAESILKNKDIKKLKIIKTELNNIEKNHEKLLKIIDSSPILQEIKPLSINLLKIAELGKKVIELYELNKKPESSWIKDAREILDKAKKPYGQVEIVIINSIEKLVGLLE